MNSTMQKLEELTSALPEFSPLGKQCLVQEYPVENGVCFRFPLYALDKKVSVDRWFFSAGVIHKLHSHKDQEECIFVYEGTVETTVAGVVHKLTAGQSLHISHGEPHWSRMLTDVRVITIVYPTGYYVASEIPEAERVSSVS